ncbi:histidine kinase [Actinoplanes sp. TRM 88003]|uniref:histidine kinase n=1 Tax=Paractinoplanes aksuensis TaxID=2939490 RepID=A0ABT1E3Y4_9ACTN|nr:histidine kinase [Actinoplanes aksuensis]MCO8277854.1 histidine kinase [Actinoplanes aksuensis]
MRGRREWVADGLIGSSLLGPVLIHQVMNGDALRIVAALAVTAGLVLTLRRRPLVGLLVVLLGTLADGNFVFALPVMSYLVGLRTERIRAVAATFAVIAAGGTALNFTVFDTALGQWFFLAMALLLLGVFPWLAGRYRAQHARLVSAGWERAARLEYERRLVVREARLRERARIAQEMHDSLGHELSLIALNAGALETTPGLPGKQSAAAGRIRESAANATDRLRDIIGVLRDDDETDTGTVEQLVDRARAAGMTILLQRDGEPSAVAYPVVREALTNAGVHAPGATVRITLTADAVEVVTDAADRPPVHGTTGLGLIGLKERVRRAGGTLTAGPTPDGAFRTAAVLDRAAPQQPTVDAELHDARRRTRRSLAAAILTPLVLVVVTAIGYYPFAVAGSVLDEATFDALTTGTPRADLADRLPDRQTPGDKPRGCELYTDGNFPMAEAAYRLCFTDGRLTSKERLK